MKNYLLLATILCLVSVTGCAKAEISKSRESYILSQPHGWLELSIVDENVPSVLQSKDLSEEQKRDWQPSPPMCGIAVFLNGERFLRESIFPYGSEPPYLVDTGFRFPVPGGAFNLVVEYYDCDVEDDKYITISVSAEAAIEEGKVLPVLFDGEALSIYEQEENRVITLEDIYQKLEQLEGR